MTRRRYVCLVLFFPPKGVALDPDSGAPGGRPPGRRRELVNVSNVTEMAKLYAGKDFDVT